MSNIPNQPSLDLSEFPLEKIHDPRNKKATRTEILSRHATMNFLISTLYHNQFKRQLSLEHSLGDGFFFLDSTGEKINEEQIKSLEEQLTKILKSDEPILLLTMDREELVERFRKMDLIDKLAILKPWQTPRIPIIKCGDLLDYILEPMCTDKSILNVFEIRPFEDGIIFRLPTLMNPTELEEWKDPKALRNMFSEYKAWAKLINVENVGKMNNLIFTGKIKDIKLVNEGLHERKFAMIADKLCAEFDEKRVITVAGPSSSNKTTFAKRLNIQLNVNGYTSTIIEMDDYFQDGDKIPYGKDGLQDLEHISAMNVELLAERVKKLLAGEPIPVRKYNFKLARGEDDPKKRIVLEADSFLILEGIHGLNPELLKYLGEVKVTRIYVSALTPMKIDTNHRYPTSDLRLIRRIVRDNQFRGCNARKTLLRWTSVRVGEERNIFPYQGNADYFFNSSLVYELPVLSIFARVLLSEATIPDPNEDPNTEESKEITTEAKRLLDLVNLCYPLSPEVVPRNSCIREFIGGSELEY